MNLILVYPRGMSLIIDGDFGIKARTRTRQGKIEVGEKKRNMVEIDGKFSLIRY
jgi:hypothetical protein